MEDNFITLKIDDKEVKAKEGTTILKAAKQVGKQDTYSGSIRTKCKMKN